MQCKYAGCCKWFDPLCDSSMLIDKATAQSKSIASAPVAFPDQNMQSSEPRPPIDSTASRACLRGLALLPDCARDADAAFLQKEETSLDQTSRLKKVKKNHSAAVSSSGNVHLTRLPD